MSGIGKAITERIQSNPTGFSEIIRLSLLALVTLGLHLTVEQIIAIVAPVSAILAFFAHGASTSTVSPSLAVGTSVNAGSAVVASIDPPPAPVAEGAKP